MGWRARLGSLGPSGWRAGLDFRVGGPLVVAAVAATSAVVAAASIVVNGPLGRFDLRVGGPGSARLDLRVGGPGSTFGSADH